MVGEIRITKEMFKYKNKLSLAKCGEKVLK
jgi:hypothetical protein